MPTLTRANTVRREMKRRGIPSKPLVLEGAPHPLPAKQIHFARVVGLERMPELEAAVHVISSCMGSAECCTLSNPGQWTVTKRLG